MEISMIAAMGSNRVIGKDNDIPWRIPRDWEYVKKTTSGHTIILGRKNYDSIGRPLPGRRNIVMTRDMNVRIEGCEMAWSVEDIFQMCAEEEEIFIFGGEEIYKLFMTYAEKLYITKIHHAFKGDTFFPEWEENEWEEVSVEKGITDQHNPYSYTFHIFVRKVIWK
ncbi:dihydrofolate reductase [Fictibacillus aquaticus]|uniref:Dihydrofolate reductase n=1 Tax=Fictibacillus aquaticus TaxID=2021314 RepID=A0A235FDC7_9BACL|nr:dihydrofolate reductase [Fictibacillus aquaticus]OYD59356.1 hypothetical protein CGZ90_05560 [Fictibacillus aquaticus]